MTTTLSEPERRVSSPDGELQIDLKDRHLAAFIGWLIPGSGHLYQGRYGKGVLMMVCILGTYFFGLYLGQGKVVYASMRSDDRRLPYLCQVGVGLPALPALIQSYRVRHGKQPLWGGLMAPPDLARGFRAKDTSGKVIRHPDQLAKWHYELNMFFELGTVYTMIAGLLNILAVYDAWAGPMMVVANGATKAGEDKT